MSSNTTAPRPSRRSGGVRPPAYPKARMPAALAASTPKRLSSTTAQRAGSAPIRAAGWGDRAGAGVAVGRGLAVGALVAAEDPALEPFVQAGVAEGEAELVVAAAGGDARRDGDLVEALQEGVHREQSGGQRLPR